MSDSTLIVKCPACHGEPVSDDGSPYPPEVCDQCDNGEVTYEAAFKIWEDLPEADRFPAFDPRAQVEDDREYTRYAVDGPEGLSTIMLVKHTDISVGSAA